MLDVTRRILLLPTENHSVMSLHPVTQQNASHRVPVTGCSYKTPEDSTVDLSVVLLQLHSKDHDTNSGAKPKKVTSLHLPQWNY